MIARTKDWLKAHWPRLRLRTVLFATLFVVAALPGCGAVFLRVYENTLVRQTEAELVAQGAALAATAAATWPGAAPEDPLSPFDLRPEPPQIDLSATPVLPDTPLPTPGGAPDAAAERASNTLLPILRRTRQVTLADPVLLDSRGRITAGPFAGSGLAALPEVRAAIAGRPATVLRRNGRYRATYAFEWLSRAADIRVQHARPIVVHGKVVGVLLLSRSARALFRGLYEDRGKIAVGIAAILATLFFLTALLSRSIARPIDALRAATRSVAAGGGIVPPPPATAAVEIQDLYHDFAAMAAAIDRRSRYLRDFAHAVSHEFKTPLAGIRGALELLADHEMAAADRTRFLGNADADAQRLQHLVTRLLELARADMTPGGTTSSDLGAAARRVADAVQSAGFTVALDLPPLLPVALAGAALESILTTLALNSSQAGAHCLTVKARHIGEVVTVTLADDGPGIAPGDRARIFEPFFTTRRAQGGSGLGLAIARSLLDTVGGTIELVEATTGTTLALTLPPAR